MHTDSNGRTGHDIAEFETLERFIRETGATRSGRREYTVVRLDDLRPGEVVTIPGMPDALRWSLAVDRSSSPATNEAGRSATGRIVLHAPSVTRTSVRAADLTLREDIAATMYGWIIPPEPVRRALGDLAPGAAFQYEPDGPLWERSRDPEPFHQVRVIRRDGEGRVIDTAVQHEDTDVIPGDPA